MAARPSVILVHLSFRQSLGSKGIVDNESYVPAASFLTELLSAWFGSTPKICKGTTSGPSYGLLNATL